MSRAGSARCDPSEQTCARNEHIPLPCTSAPATRWESVTPTEPRQPVGRRKRAHDVADKLEAPIAADEFEVGTQLPSERI